MTDTAAPRRPAPDPQEDWAATRGVLMSYAYLGSRPQAIDSSSAENILDLRSDLRTPVGAVLAAPLAIAMLDAATVNVEGMRVLAVTQVDVNIVDCALDIRRAHLAGRITTEMRSQLFTEARIADAEHPAGTSDSAPRTGRCSSGRRTGSVFLSRARRNLAGPDCRRCGTRIPAVDGLTARWRSLGCPRGR